MNQPYTYYAMPIITQIVTHAGFSTLYLWPIDFNQIYQQRRKQESSLKPESIVAPTQTENEPGLFNTACELEI